MYATKPHPCSEPFSPSGKHLNRTLDLDDTYQQIGLTLLSAEVSNFKVGLPWILPVSRVQKLREQYADSELLEFVKTNLVDVKTNELRLFADDLESEEVSSRDLKIELKSNLERYSFAGLVFVLVFLAVYALLYGFNYQPFFSLPFSLLAALPFAGLSALTLCSEAHRRATFYWLVQSELMRRSGVDPQGGNKNGLKLFLNPQT